MKIEQTLWITGYFSAIGIIAGIGDDGVKRAYIGCTAGIDELVDQEYIAKNGSPIDADGLEDIINYLKR